MFAKSARLCLAPLLVIVAVIFTVAAVKAQSTSNTQFSLGPLAVQAPADTPPGLATQDWLPLGDHSGLAILGQASQGTVIAQLWVKVGTTWRPALLQAPTDTVLPAGMPGVGPAVNPPR